MSSTYSIIRRYAFKAGFSPVIKRGLSLEQAKAHCQDPETNSQTSSDKSHEAEHGPWADAFRKESESVKEFRREQADIMAMALRSNAHPLK